MVSKVFYACLLGLLFFFPWYHGLTGLREQLAAELGLFVLSLLAFRYFQFPVSKKESQTPVDYWLFLSLLMTGLYVVLSVLPYYSFLTFTRYFSLILLYYLTRGLVTNRIRAEGILWAILLVGFVYSVYGLVQFYGYLPSDYWYRPRSLASRYVNGGHFAGFLFMPLFSGLALCFTKRGWTAKLFALILMLAVLCALAFTRSRTVWISLVIGLAFFLGLLWKRGLLDKRTMLVMAVIAVCGALVLWQIGGLEKIAERFNKIWDGTRLNLFSVMHRFQFWHGSLRAMAARPWGWGLGTFVHIFPQFGVHSDRFLTDYAHNEFFQIGVDMGLPGILFVLALLGIYVTRVLGFLDQREPDPDQRVLAAASLACVLSLVLASQYDFPLRIFATALTLAVYLAAGIFFTETPKTEAVHPHRKWGGAKGAFFLVILVLSVTTARQLDAELHYRKGVVLDRQFEWVSAQQNFEKAVESAPLFSEYHEALARLFMKKKRLAFGPAKKQKYRRLAIEALKKAVSVHPHWAGTQFVLATLYVEDARWPLAQRRFEEAIRLDPQNAEYASEYAYRTLEYGDAGKAVSLFERFQKIRFKEGTDKEPCGLLRKVYRRTTAIRDLRRVISGSEQDQMCLASILGENERWTEAKTEFDRIMKTGVWNEGAAFYRRGLDLAIADIYFKAERYAEALELYQAILDRSPDHKKALAAIKEIERQKTAKEVPLL